MSGLLGSSEPAAFEVLRRRGHSDVVLVCDHASNRMPLQLHALGLGEKELESHIAWDPGAFQVARYLSAFLDAPLVFSNYSRLVVDCNRFPESMDFIPACSAGVAITGNQELSVGEVSTRRQTLFDPYHLAIDTLLQARTGRTSLLLSIHSFTPMWQGIERPMPIGVCYGDEQELARRWMAGLQDRLCVPVGDNEPYAIEPNIDYTLPVHGKKHDIPVIMLEIRQNEIDNVGDAEKWGRIICSAFQALNRNDRSRTNLSTHPW